MNKDRSFVNTTLLKLLNEQTDLTGTQIDLIDGFLFMLQKLKRHKQIRMIDSTTIHPRFWRSHNRAFGYKLKTKANKGEFQFLYEFYVKVALLEGFVDVNEQTIYLTEKGRIFLLSNKEDQLDLLFQYIWG
ncbi:hypothetical protein [Alkalihalobacillus pseudalcaliphilus]|uniref:hypothetical protein n=1 Tax=Alkalihalobacillus pseudalcaliphilus TaxID=79884 RepID=UPI00064DC2C5|nr:hypothetical protein [Alkalihalobacillus pseudalcaliphilus]KMK76485.1 hypothetical protein AB990_14980 [Alkalihalobacillus pseudalcaliphilus]